VAQISSDQARVLAHSLGLDLDEIPICLAWLSLVAFPLEAGNDREVRRALAYVAPHSGRKASRGRRGPHWSELGERVAYAEAALADVNAHGHRSRAVREIVPALAADLARGYTTSTN